MKPGNFTFEFMHDDFKTLKMAGALAMDDEKAAYFRIEEENKAPVLVLYEGWNAPSDKIKLPFKLTRDNVGDFLIQWLENIDSEDYPKCPDTDGSVHKGFYLTADRHDCILRIRPYWGVYGK